MPLFLAMLSIGIHPMPETTTSVERDRKEILEHIHSIFQAYIRKDREAIRRTHSEDWTGFLMPSGKIERGIDDYMAYADRAIGGESLGVGYELLDTEVQIYGDIALVYYVARWDRRDADGSIVHVPLRSIDVYRRDAGGWIQCGSHITAAPSVESRGSSAAESTGQRAPHAVNGTKDTAAGAQRAVEQGSAVSGLSREERDELMKVREAVWRAWFGGDEEALRQLLPDDLITLDSGSDAWGDLHSNVRNSAAFKADGGRLVRLVFPRTRIQSYGDTAILYTTFELELERGGQRSVCRGQGTEIFLRRGGKWLNTGWQLDMEDVP